MSEAHSESSVIGGGRRLDLAVLVAGACVIGVASFVSYGFARAHVFSNELSWSVYWRSMWAPAMVGVPLVSAGIGAVLLWRELLRTRLAVARIRMKVGVCAVCSYKAGVRGLDRCPECGASITGDVPRRLAALSFGRVAAVSLVLLSAALIGGLVSDGLIRWDERAFLNEVALRQAASLTNAPYHRARVWRFGGYGMTFINGRVVLTD